jgi:hypothetical protein
VQLQLMESSPLHTEAGGKKSPEIYTTLRVRAFSRPTESELLSSFIFYAFSTVFSFGSPLCLLSSVSFFISSLG